MGMHTGNPCFACGKTLGEDDDVVVCPECGTPYHRECWMKNQKCINLMLHASGESWKPERPAEVPKPERICANCGTGNASDAQRCRNCGVPLQDSLSMPSWQKDASGENDVPPQSDSLRERLFQMGMDDSYCGMNQEDTIGDERLGDVADFVEHNNLYYLPKFRRFHEGHRISLNFPCLIFPQYYFANRKMWPFAMILVGIFTLLRLPQTVITLQAYLQQMLQALGNSEESVLLQDMLDKMDVYETMLYNAAVICNYVELCVTILLAVFGNWLYYRFVLRQVHRIVNEDLSAPMRRLRLRSEGGTNGWLIVGMIGLQFVLAGVISAILLAILMV